VIGLLQTDHGLSYRLAGNGTAVVFLHGIGSSSRSWRQQLENLPDGYTKIAWDAPGYGGSADPEPSWRMADYAAALGEFLDDLGVDRVHLVGSSMGGVIAAEFCRYQQDRLYSLTLADTHRGGAAKDPEVQRRELDRRLTAFRELSREDFASQRAPRLLSPEAPPELLEEAVSIMEEVRSPGYETAAVALAESDVRDVLPTIAVPTLVLCGDFDRVTPPEEAQRIATAVQGARLEIIPSAGHLSNQENPSEFNRLVLEHVSSFRPGNPAHVG
jgi:pimeloyl-ACP methyl ester carboxylesterase